jgi:hypothetical protein
VSDKNLLQLLSSTTQATFNTSRKEDNPLYLPDTQIAGLVLAITPLLLGCKKVIKIIQDVRTKCKTAPLTMISIATECSTVSTALSQLQFLSQGEGREHIMHSIEASILGCTLTLSVLEEYIMGLQSSIEDSILKATNQAGMMAKAMVVWKEDEMKELLQQLQSHQINLKILLTVLQR